MSNFIKEIFNLYMESIKDEEEINSNYSSPKTGDLLLFSYQKKPIYCLLIGEEGKYYKLLKTSEWYQLGNQNDLLTEVAGERFIIETWNVFYLTEEEIKRSKLIGHLSDEDKKILFDFIEGKIKELPKHKRGLTVPEGNYAFYQNKFHREEARAVKELSMRVFLIMEDDDETLIQLPPEKLSQQPLVAGEEQESYGGENFTLFLEKEENLIILVPNKNIIGKKAVLRVFDQEYITDSLPDELEIEIPESVKQVNLAYIGENISIEV